MLNAAAALAGMKATKTAPLGDYLFAHSLAFAIVRRM
jgi:hypothetical protein